MFEGGAIRDEASGKETGGDFPQAAPDERGWVLAAVCGIETRAEPAEFAGGDRPRDRRRHGGGGDENLRRVLQRNLGHLSAPELPDIANFVHLTE